MRLALGLLLAALGVRWIAGTVGAAAGTGARYREARIELAFQGLPVDSLAAALDVRLLRGTPVRLGESFRSAGPWDFGFVEQRLTESLYPRWMTAKATHSLEIQPAEPAVDALARIADGSLIVLRGPRTTPAAAPPRVVIEPPAPGGWLLRALALLGLGRLLGWVLATRGLAPSALESILVGVLAVALAAHSAVWLDVALPWTALLVAGLLGWLAPRRDSAAPDPAPPRDRTALALETLLLCALGAFAVRTLFVPVSGWDGRSIWLFHARQVALAEAPGTAISSFPELHPTYPLLLPAHLAFFGTSDSFNERAAAASLAVLFACCVALCWKSSQPLLGRATAALFALAAVLVTTDGCAEAYADGFLALLLAAQFLGSLRPGTAALPLLAAAAAGLLKREGLPLALLIQLASRGRRGLASCLVALVPGALHVAWASWHGLANDFSRLHAPTSVVELGERLYWILRIGTRKVLLSEALMLGFVAALLALAALATRRVPWRSLTGRSMLAAAAALAFAVLTFLVTSRPLVWHLDTAFGRLLLHPALLGVLAMLGAAPQPRIERSH